MTSKKAAGRTTKIKKEVTNLIFLHEKLTAKSLELMPLLINQAIMLEDKIAEEKTYQLFFATAQRVFWYYKNVLPDENIQSLKIFTDKDEFVKSYLINSNGVMIEFRVEGFNNLAAAVLTPKNLKKGINFKWEDLKDNGQKKGKR